MNLCDIIRKTNVSTILILPIFRELAEGITFKLTQYSFHLLPLFYEYGLLKTFCYSYLSKDRYSLFLVFDRELVNQNMTKTNKPGLTLTKIISESKFFGGLDVVGDLCIFNLKIPNDYYEDVDLIRKGEYSKVSDAYKKHLHISGNILKKALLKSELSYEITKENLAYFICKKAPKIKENLEEYIDSIISDDSELYDRFSIKKEFLTEEKLDNLVLEQKLEEYGRGSV